MAIKVFLLGRPGAGKSTAARHMHVLSKEHHWSTLHINDYPFLFALFESDVQHQRFQPSSCGGFDVTDFSVLDTALQAVEREAERYLICEQQILLLEFARDDYRQALSQFKPEFLHDAYFLFFATDIDTCIKRVDRRSHHPIFKDDHFISEEMIRNYYHADIPLQTYHLLHEYGVSEKCIHIIDNSGSQTHLHQQVQDFTEFLIQCKPNPKSHRIKERKALKALQTSPIMHHPLMDTNLTRQKLLLAGNQICNWQNSGDQECSTDLTNMLK